MCWVEHFSKRDPEFAEILCSVVEREAFYLKVLEAIWKLEAEWILMICGVSDTEGWLSAYKHGWILAIF